jgi:hypothetical protein
LNNLLLYHVLPSEVFAIQLVTIGGYGCERKIFSLRSPTFTQRQQGLQKPMLKSRTVLSTSSTASVPLGEQQHHRPCCGGSTLLALVGIARLVVPSLVLELTLVAPTAALPSFLLPLFLSSPVQGKGHFDLDPSLPRPNCLYW